MTMALVDAIQKKTKWVASALSLKRLRNKRSRQARETTELQPIALAGASKNFTGSSRQCNTFARTPSTASPAHSETPQHAGERLDRSKSSDKWKSCRMCTREFLACTSSRPYSAFCSLDCKSAHMLGGGDGM